MNRRHLRTSLVLVVVLSLTGAIENIISIAQTKEQVQINTELRNEILVASIDKDIKVAEKIVDEWYIPELEERLPKKEQKIFYDLSQKYGLDYILTLSVARVETNFNNEVSETNDYGQMQCNINNKKYCQEIAGRKLDFDDNYDSIEAGMIMLKNCFDSWNGKYKDNEKQLLLHAISSYNTGVRGTKNIVSRGGNLSKRTYPSNVLEVYKSYMNGEFDIDPYE